MPNPYDPWSAKPDPRKSTVPCHVQLDVSQNLWLLARPLGLMAKADQGERLFPAGFTFYETWNGVPIKPSGYQPTPLPAHHSM